MRAFNIPLYWICWGFPPRPESISGGRVQNPWNGLTLRNLAMDNSAFMDIYGCLPHLNHPLTRDSTASRWSTGENSWKSPTMAGQDLRPDYSFGKAIWEPALKEAGQVVWFWRGRL